jgi:D-serine deaminase-like pyridoxal phosphate-dependent protein
MERTNTVSRRGFLAQSAAVGALSCMSGTPVQASAAPQAGEDAQVAPQYRGFLKKHVTELPTPAPLIDLDILTTTFRRWRRQKGRPVSFRPHGKAHKSPAIGKLQLASGATGLCAAKLGEADVLVRGGVKDVLITAEVVGRVKIERLMALLAMAPDLKAVVTAAERVDLSTAALATKRKLKVAIDVNVGQNRTGLDKPEDVVALAQAIAKRGLELIGLQGTVGTISTLSDSRSRRAREVQSNERVVAARQALEKAGFAVQLVSVGGTGSYNIDADYTGVTRSQPGSYLHGLALQQDRRPRQAGVHRVRQLAVGADDGDQPCRGWPGDCRCRRESVIDRPESVPEPMDLTGAVYGVAGDDYGALRLQNPSRDLKVGDLVQIMPGHCDTTVNLHNVYFGVRKYRRTRVAHRGVDGRTNH